jgi:GSCFA family
MLFRTALPAQPASFPIGYESPILGIGSCFIENIGQRLKARQLPFIENPFGIVYNPLSMARQLEMILDKKTFLEADLVNINGLWHSWEHHGRFSGVEKKDVLSRIHQELNLANAFFQNKSNANRLFLTFGTSKVFELKTTQTVVANCHKAPPQYFTTRRLSVEEIVAAWQPILEKLFLQNTDLQIVITVSPIRHLREGLVDNNLSKAVLLLATAALCELFPNNVHYFPAYELVIDDLRDYRFYEKDMTHPNELAIDYIWQYFSQTYFSPETRHIISEVEKINAQLAHRPLHGADTEGYQKFITATQERAATLVEKYPFLSFNF